MSVFIAIELPPLLLISFESWLRISIFRDANTTLDVFASFIEIDFPIPDEAPVTIYVDLEIFIDLCYYDEGFIEKYIAIILRFMIRIDEDKF